MDPSSILGRPGGPYLHQRPDRQIGGFAASPLGTGGSRSGEDRPDRTWVFLSDPRTFTGIDGTAGVVSEVADSILMVSPGNYVLVVQRSWGCQSSSASATSCFVSGERSAHRSLLTFYFGFTIVGTETNMAG